MATNFQSSVGGAYQLNEGGKPAFPGENGEALRHLPRRNEPRVLTLPDAIVVKWCNEC